MTDRPRLENTQQVLQLPEWGRQAGPIHSLIRDESGNYYCTDEINHRIVSFDASGDLRWQIDAAGSPPTPLRYPRGLATGWILADGSVRQCLAVCDSWNNRLVFLNLAGGSLNQWETAGDTRFQEVCDVRYLSGPQEADGYWLVLDRGNHRLCGLGLDGRLLFQVGHAFSPNLVHPWRIPGRDWIDTSAGPIEVFEPCDTVYYPARIVGASSDAIYLWEPLYRTLYQVLYGNLLPIRMPPSCDEWLAADAAGLIGWDAKSRQLRRYGSHRELILEISLEGTPIAADLSREEVWVQQADRIARHTWRKAAAPAPPTQPEIRFPILLDSADEDLARFNLEEADAARDRYFGCIDSLLNLAGSWELPEHGGLDLLTKELDESWSELSLKVTPWHVGVLKWKLAEVPGAKTRSGPLEERIRTTWESLSLPFLEKFREVMQRLDAVLMTGDAGTFTARLEAELWLIVNELSQASGELRRSTKVVDLGSANSLQYPTPRHRDNFTLREVARWKLNDLDKSLTSPYGLTAASDGSLFVSFWNNRTILRLDKQNGELAARLDQPDSAPSQLQSPRGIALDELGRLWVIDGSLNSILIWDFRNGRSQVVKGEEPEVGGFLGPLGICAGPEGFMLVSDYENNRIVRISLEGRCDVFTGGRGSGPGKFQHPRALCKSTTAEGMNTFLVADSRNHRIQRLDSSGKFRGEIGGCGLEKGKLVLPLSVAEFADGALAVSMWHVKRSLVLLSSTGEELGEAVIDYSPGDMLVYEGRLLVPDFEGNAIRVYERMA